MDDTDARVITEQLGELTSLNLSACQVGDAGARAIAGPFVLNVVERLAQVLGRDRVFYDPWYEARLLGSGGDLKLQAFYQQAEMVVPFFSEHYGKKWCAMEWETIRGILLDRRADDAVIPVHLDDTDIAGWPPVSFGIHLQGRSAKEIADLILEAYHQRHPTR